jgi:site-specific recombinase XerD
MKLSAAVDAYVADMERAGRFRSAHTALAYRTKLDRLAEHVRNRDPRTVGRSDVRAVLAQWPNANSQRQAHAIFASFFDWCMTEPRDRSEREMICKFNPARQVQRAKRTKPDTYRMTRGEVARFLEASNDRRRDRWVAHLLCCAGLRNAELRALQGRHFARPGWVWVEHGKGSKQRWVPVLPDLEPVVDEILTLVGIDEYVIPGRRVVDPPWNTKLVDDPHRQVSQSGLCRQVIAIGERAGIAGRITPHTCRHGFGDHVAKYAGLRVAQWLMGHEDVSTTADTYTSRPSLDEIAAHVRGFSYRTVIEPAPVIQRPTGGSTA